MVLDDFSLTIPAGKVTALCGMSEQVSWGGSLHSVRRRGGEVVVGLLEEHSLCGQKMETATVTTDNLWFAVL